MASREKIDALFALPVFQNSLTTLLAPMHTAMADAMTTTPEERAEFLKDAGAIQADALKALVDFQKKMFTETLTDEQVDAMIAAYQAPAFAKMAEMLPQMSTAFMSWQEKNAKALQEQFARFFTPSKGDGE